MSDSSNLLTRFLLWLSGAPAPDARPVKPPASSHSDARAKDSAVQPSPQVEQPEVEQTLEASPVESSDAAPESDASTPTQPDESGPVEPVPSDEAAVEPTPSEPGGVEPPPSEPVPSQAGEEVADMAAAYRVYYRRVDTEGGDYTMDHTAGSYVFDTQGRIRLYHRYNSGAEALASDVRRLLAEADR